jgi:hypothetical protein
MPNLIDNDRPLVQRRVDSNRRISTIAEQIANASQLQITSATSIDDLPRCDRHGIWPNLAAMATDVLSIPLMSAECERVFSKTGYLISGRRGHLQEDIIETTTCLRGWQKDL